MSYKFFVFLFFILSVNAIATWDETLLPWSAPGSEYSDWTWPETPRLAEDWERLAVQDTPLPELLWLPSLVASDLLWAYQHSLSGKTGSRCPFYPSCSRYARIAIEDYGFNLGVLMTAERFSRCHGHANNAGQYPLRIVSGKMFIWNPPHSDTWWKESKP